MKHTSIQRILVPLDPSEYSKAATLRACEVARAHYAQVEGLVILDSPEIRSTIAPLEMQNWPAVIDAMSSAISEAEEQIGDLRRHFAETCESLHTTHQEVQLEGLPPNLILEASALFDLVVVGLRTFFHFETRDTPGDSLVKILDRTVTPVLAVPSSEPTPIKQVVIAYDGSFNSARTLRDFVAFAKPYDFELTLFSADKDKDHAKHSVESAAAYLRSHDFENASEVISKGAPFEAFEKEGLLEKADLIVTGIHSRKFIKDAFVGSFAKSLIEHGDVPLFLSH
ncbi:MAG: universal stress protein [Verrucomicrobiota bacterium]